MGTTVGPGTALHHHALQGCSPLYCGDKQYTLVSLPCCPYLQINEQKEEVKKKLRERRVPSSAFGRAAGFAGMGASLVFGSMRDSVSTFWTAMYCGIT